MRSQEALGEMGKLWTSFFCYTVSTSMSAPLIGLQALRLGASATEIGAIYGLAAFTTLLTRLPLASLQSRLGSQSLIRIGVLTNSASLITYALSPTIHYMFIASGLRGIGFASFHPPVLSEAVRISGGGHRLGWVMTSPPIGMSLGPLISSATLSLFSPKLGIGQAYTLTFLVGAALSGVAFLTPVRSTESQSRVVRVREEFAKMLDREMMILVATRFMVSYVVGAVTAFLPVLVVEANIASEAQVPLLFAWSSLFNVLGRPLSALLKSPTRGMMASSILITLSGALFHYSNVTTIYAAMSLYGLSLGLFIPSSLMFVQSINKGSSLTLRIAFLTLALDLGASVGSFGTGFLRAFVGIDVALASTALLLGLLSTLTTRWLTLRRV